ncbi:hypothetical protein Rsub_12819 [Raphidocelis subcapitata]|uniref:FG-GAP repeat-containing protein n=1 Tax=Raphidocelis subcapitata TaxID=307507 RepID=A0A2V0PJD2_9CHLO|nr:hypothetical protein Rsub_12819 [Raphidocelis subcapitata]|eukprot:GBF99911.1 hypothetical protein Rsub_12819 [Raphidocelis subcapitata]
MRKRDVAIVLLSCFGLFLSLENEGSISFRKAWYHTGSSRLGEKLAEFDAAEALPPPLVVDLNGDGSLEVVTITHDYSLLLLKPAPPGRAGEGFAPATVIAQASLLPQKIVVGVDRRPVALAAGYLDPEPRERVRPPRKQVLVVVTASWRVMAFDHNLALLWEADVEGGAGRARARLHEVAVLVTPHRVRTADRGLIVVGGDTLVGRLAAGAAGLDEAAAEGARSAGGVLAGVLEDEEAWEAAEASRARSAAGAAGEGAGVAAGTALGAGADASRHFDYHAFEGATGDARWSHTAGSFHGAELEAASEELTPQNSYKLDAERLAARHYGELSCRDFRESVLHALPHLWARPLDTRLEAAAFVRHREGAGSMKQQLARTAAERAASAGRGSSPPSASWLFNAGRRSRTPAAAAREQRGAAARHPYLAANNSAANAVVGHIQEGLEVVHLYTGRTLCELHLPAGQLHADVNGDGVIDHIALSAGGRGGDDGPPLLHHVASRGHASLGGCLARATSGIPPHEVLWVADLCARRRGVEESLLPARDAAGGGFVNAHGASHGGDDLSFAPPAFLPLPRADGGYSQLRGQNGLVGVLGSDGVITALSQHGDRLWQRFLETGWNEELTPGMLASLLPLPLRRGGVPAALLAVGADLAVAVSEHGSELARLPLAFPPLSPPLVADFDGDGLNDLVFVTAGGLFGYAQVQHLGGLNLGALLLALMVALAVVWWGAQQGDPTAGGARARKLRSTDVD